MVKTKCLDRISPDFLRPRGAHSSLRSFEKKILKYYPKRFRIFENSQLSQDDQFLKDKNYRHRPLVDFARDYSPHQRILRKYRADFFRSFKAFYELEGGPRPTRIPHNIKHLALVEGDGTFLKKLIKHNKRLKHITLEPEYWKIPELIARYLKYSKGVCSITFQETRPIFSEKACRKMLRDWKNTLQRVEMLGSIFHESENFTRLMQTLLKFPKLKEFRFLGQTSNCAKGFPLTKLQERNIPYDIRFSTEGDNFESLRDNLSKLKSVDWLIISKNDYKYNKANQRMTKEWKLRDLSQKILRLGHLPFGFNLLALFEKISSLDVKFSQVQSDYSSLGSLSNLRNLGLNITNASYLKDFLGYFHENAAQQTKLETFSLKGKFMAELSKENSDALIHFFGVYSENLRIANFELSYRDLLNNDSLGYLSESLSKFKHLKSLSLTLLCCRSGSVEQFERLGKIILGMKFLEELNFKIKNVRFNEQKLSLTFPVQLKKLGLGRDALCALFDLNQTLSSLSNLVSLELESESESFDSKKWKKNLEKLKLLEVLVLKDVETFSDGGEALKMGPRLNDLMEEYLSLRLIIFVQEWNRETSILRRNCPWPEIDKICHGLSPYKPLKICYIKSFSEN